jgi:thiol-disulfide isomerase/thioredoxin
VVARVDALEKSVRTLQKEFTNSTEVVGLLLAVAQGRLAQGQTEQARALAVEVADAIKDPDIQEAAQALLKSIQRIGKPLAIKFKAIDGREVDLAALRGKVVLIDFWATWCGPCMAEMPKVKALHEKLNPKGFEIIGISLDQDRKALDRVIARDKIPWPQHLETAPGAEKFTDAFGIESIPTLWLVDKKGNLRDVNGIEDLEGKVAKLLAE